jgi:hypothetical protein
LIDPLADTYCEKEQLIWSNAMTSIHQVNDSLTALTAEQREKAMMRFEVLKPHLEEGVPLPRVACESGVGSSS